MFYCDNCAQERLWPRTAYRSRGPCEICGMVTTCNSRSARQLAESKNEVAFGTIMPSLPRRERRTYEPRLTVGQFKRVSRRVGRIGRMFR